MNSLNKKQIMELLPHREPMLLIDELKNIKKLFSATAIVNVKKDSFYVNGHFPGEPVMPGVLIVEAFGQAAAALTACGIDPKEYDNKLVYLMSVEKAKFRNPVLPDCELHLEIEAIRSHGRVWKYKGTAKVEIFYQNLLKKMLLFHSLMRLQENGENMKELQLQ
jgi:3-hydroxyacyl-[acyl-carrier-protein] dehydratase